jgi:hypothetical protein
MKKMVDVALGNSGAERPMTVTSDRATVWILYFKRAVASSPNVTNGSA